jgi:benzil reductase ((S)-benzoin forming)
MRQLFITGASRGFGLALAKRLDSENTRITGLARTRGDFEGNFVNCDFSDPKAAAETLEAAFAQTAVFIANSGTLEPIDFLENLTIEEILNSLATNLTGSFICLQRFLIATRNLEIPKLFIQISSGAALPERAKPSWSLYCAAKSGQEQLARTVAKEQSYAPFPAKVINFNPGVMETAMQEFIRATPRSAFPDVDRFIELKENGQINAPETIADALAKLIDSHDKLDNGAAYQYSDFSVAR